MWPFSRKNNELEIKFDTAAAEHAHHGNIVVTCRAKGLVNASVRFAFVGMETPPPLSKDIFDHIWTQAERQGYIPHFIRNYNYNKPGHMSLRPAAGSFNRATPTAKGPADLTPQAALALSVKAESLDQARSINTGTGTHWRLPTEFVQKGA